SPSASANKTTHLCPLPLTHSPTTAAHTLSLHDALPICFRSVTYNSPVTRLLFDLRRTTDAGLPFAPWSLKRAAALVQKLRDGARSEEHTSELQSRENLVCRLLLEKKKTDRTMRYHKIHI